MSLSISTAVDRLVLRAVQEHWSNSRLDAAITRARELRADAPKKSTGKPCGNSYIPKGSTCHKGAVRLTPLLSPAPLARATAIGWEKGPSRLGPQALTYPYH
jgi:hypothetical protein